MMPDSVGALTELIRRGLEEPASDARALLNGLFEDRYHSRHRTRDAAVRDAHGLARSEAGEEGIPYAGLIHPENPPSGPYGGTSLVWFPTQADGSLIALVVGTRGLSPDEGILTRPGHHRRISALRRYLARQGVASWTKPDPAALSIDVPRTVVAQFAGFDRVFKRYGHELYCIAAVPRNDQDRARLVVQAFLDLYALERRWEVRSAWRAEYERLHAQLREDLFPRVTAAVVDALLRARRFVVLQGPPGTGKTRLAELVRREYFDGNGTTIQFHPSVTYEDFVVGLSPDPREGTLRFEVKPGWLVQAADAALGAPFLLIVDEVNRADLGKVLGEAIYLFEPSEVGGAAQRRVRLPHAVNGQETLALPENLYVLATMNTADRSISGMDLAVRRRFAFMTMYPDRSVVADQSVPLALSIFDNLTDVFVEYASQELLNLLPGHSYFLAEDEEALRGRFRYELLPLLDEYLREGYLGAATSELHAVRDRIEDLLR